MSWNSFLDFFANPIGALTGKGSSGTIWNHGSEYTVPSAGESANEFSGTGMDPDGLVAGLWNDITGVTSQSREFAQQEYLQDKMNEYNTPANQMARMKDAGINPNTAAAGIAQSGSESAQAPAVASNAGGAAQGLAAAATGVASLGSGAAGIAAAKETLSLLGTKGRLMDAQLVHELEAAGVDHWTAESIKTLLPSQSANQVADFYLKLANIDNLVAEHQVILDEHDLKLQEIRLTGSQADEAAENARFAKAQTDFFYEHGFRDDAPLDVSLRNSIISGKTDKAAKIGSAIEKYNHDSAHGQFAADAETAYERAFNRLQGEAAGNADNAKYLNDLETNKQAYLMLIESLFALPDSLKSGVVQYLFQTKNAALAAMLEEAGFNRSPEYHDSTKEKQDVQDNIRGGKNHPDKGSYRW